MVKDKTPMKLMNQITHYKSMKAKNNKKQTKLQAKIN